jgi:hypothetical protein
MLPAATLPAARSFPGRAGIVACGALPGAAAPVPGWMPGELAAAGVAAEPGRVREGTGLGLVSCVTGPALIDEALAGTPARRARKITPRLAMQLSLARALEPGTAPGGAAGAGAAAAGGRSGL